MKRYIYALLATGLVLTLSSVDLPWQVGAVDVQACGYGQGGGQGYAPQRRDEGNRNQIANRPALTEEQAQQIIEGHVTRLNSTLKVGPLNDTGELFEAEILSSDNEVVQVLGVDKRSGRIVLID